MSVRRHFYQYMGPAAVGGYAKFFSPNTSTLKTTYTSDYSTAATLNSASGVAINSNGFLNTYLSGDYDMLVYDSTGAQLTGLSASGINPQESDVEVQGGNLLSNGSFETDSNSDDTPDDWTLTSYSGATNALDSSDQRHGAQSMKFTSTGSGGGVIISDEFMPCSPLVDVFVSWAMKSTADVRNLIELIWYTAGQVEISDTDIYDNSTTNPTDWEYRSAVAAPPSTARYFKIRIYGCHSSDSTAGTVRFDDFVILTNSASGVFTGTLTGLTTSPTTPFTYRIFGRFVSLQWDAEEATSNSTGFTITGMPAIIRPAAQVEGIMVALVDNGIAQVGQLLITTTGVMTFGEGIDGNSAGFTNSGTKGTLRNNIVYCLDEAAGF
jgi:hypothetical protein